MGLLWSGKRLSMDDRKFSERYYCGICARNLAGCDCDVDDFMDAILCPEGTAFVVEDFMDAIWIGFGI